MKVNYRIAVDSGYKANISVIGNSSYDELAYQYKGNFPDVKITRPNTYTDMSLLHTKCLMTVNGYIHRTVFDDGNLYIKSATESMLTSKSNHIGILTFDRLASPLIKTDIVSSMVGKDGDIPLADKVIINFGRDVGNCFLVLAGYPVFEDPEVFYRISDRSFVLRLDKLNYVERVYELARYRNIVEELEIVRSPVNPMLLDAQAIRAENTIHKFLTLHNTFLVETDKPIATKRIYLEHSNIPGSFRTEINPNLPLIAGYGKFCEYKATRGIDQKYSIHTVDAYRDNFLFSKLSRSDIDIYNNNRIPGRTYDLSRAFFLEITIE